MPRAPTNGHTKSAPEPQLAIGENRISSHEEATGPLTVTVQNAAVMLDLSVRTIQLLVSTKELHSTVVGGRRLIFVASIREILGLPP